MPRKEYKTITVKVSTFLRFLKAKKKAQNANPDLDNSQYLDSIMGEVDE